MNQFDSTIIHFCNSFAHQSWTFDTLVELVEETNLLKGGVILGLFWWVWFREDEAQAKKREIVLFAFVSSISALLLGRMLSLAFPFRERPAWNPVLHFRVPYGALSNPISWNSIPSDHAVLFFCLATSLWFVSRRLGILAFLHAIVVVCFPRIYLGYHYPTDLLAGAVVGTAMAFTCKFTKLRESVGRIAFHWLAWNKASFYAAAFLLTFEVSELFTSSLMIEGYVRHAVRGLLLVHYAKS